MVSNGHWPKWFTSILSEKISCVFKGNVGEIESPNKFSERRTSVLDQAENVSSTFIKVMIISRTSATYCKPKWRHSQQNLDVPETHA
jgi:hypothetical protein